MSKKKEKVLQVTDDELKKLRSYLASEEDLIYSIGSIDRQIRDLKNQKYQLNSELDDLKIGQGEFRTIITEKYGDGNIHLDTGEFTAIPS